MRALIIGIALVIGLLSTCTSNTGHAQTVNTNGATLPTLKEQLETGLLARTPAEQAFVAKVVQLVDDGELPNSLVQSTFLYARKKLPYPMPYFQRALKIRAKRVGIIL